MAFLKKHCARSRGDTLCTLAASICDNSDAKIAIVLQLDTRFGTLRRVFLQCPHPSSIFFGLRDGQHGANLASMADAACNLAMRLAGSSEDPEANVWKAKQFRRFISSC